MLCSFSFNYLCTLKNVCLFNDVVLVPSFKKTWPNIRGAFLTSVYIFMLKKQKYAQLWSMERFDFVIYIIKTVSKKNSSLPRGGRNENSHFARRDCRLCT